MEDSNYNGNGRGMMSERVLEILVQDAKKAESRKEEQVNGKDAQEVFFGKKGSLDVSDHTVKNELNKYIAEKSKQQSNINTLHAFIKSIMKDNEALQHTFGHKRGKINTKNLHKYATRDYKLFKRKIEPTDKRYVMSILVDMSGSMEGENAEYAFKGCLILAEVFEMLSLPYEIIGFEGKPYVFKSFSKPLQRAILPSLMQSDGGTDDFTALKLVKKHIVGETGISDKQPKGVFVITDGMSGRPDEMKEVIKDIEQKNNAKVYGIGIGDVGEDDLKRVYNQYIAIDNVEELPRKLVDLIRSQFRRG